MKFLKIIFLIFCTAPAFAKQFHIEQWQTPNGVKVVFYQTMEVPMLDISLAFRAGSSYDGSHFGLSSLTTSLMNEGNAGLNATTIAKELDENGAQYNAEINRDMAILKLRSLASKEVLDQSISTFAKIIQHPDFPEDAFTLQKQQMMMGIKQSQESPEDIANIHFFNALYEQHPYAHPSNGTIDSIEALKRVQIVDFYKKHFVSNNAVLVLVGAIDKPTAEKIAIQITNELPKGEQTAAIAKATAPKQIKPTHVTFPSSQTFVRIGQLGIDHQNPNYFPLIVANYILGGGSLVSRLPVEIREKHGLTYNISSQLVPMPGVGPFIIGFSTKQIQAKQAIQMTQDVIKLFIKDGPSQEEIQAAKQYLTGSFSLSLASNKQIASILLRMKFYNLPNSYLDNYVARIQAVTQEDIKLAIQQLLHSDQMILTTVGPS